jgi:hypothetical protein
VCRSRKVLRARELFGVFSGEGESSPALGKRAVLETSRAVPPDPCKGAATAGVIGAGAATHALGGATVDRVGIKTREDSVKGRRTAVAKRESSSLSRSGGPALGGRG